MLTIQVEGYIKPCAPNTGGVSRVWVFDPADFDWTGIAGDFEYTAVALVAGATILGGSGFFPVQFDYLEGELKAPQSVKGSSNKYANSLALQVPVNGKELSKFIATMQQATACSSLGFVIEQNNSKVMIMGESIVNGGTIPFFRIIMDGTEIDTGKAFDDPNGAKLMFKGDYGRPLCEFTGGVDVIIGLQGTP